MKLLKMNKQFEFFRTALDYYRTKIEKLGSKKNSTKENKTYLQSKKMQHKYLNYYKGKKEGHQVKKGRRKKQKLKGRFNHSAKQWK